MSIIRDSSLSGQGARKITWAQSHMPVLSRIAHRFKQEKPFSGMTLTISIHLEAKTAYLAEVLRLGGADVYAAGSNPLSTQDDVCAALAERGVSVFAVHGCSPDEYAEFLKSALAPCPDIIIDDGGDLCQMLHDTHPEYSMRLTGGCEETTTGIARLTARARAGKLSFPMIAVNDADCKHLFDNRYGTGQSVWDGIMRTTNLTVAGSTVVIAGYGWCGKGVAMRAKGLGAKVIITEIDPLRAIEAELDGFRVMPMLEAAPLGDFFITVTGCREVISSSHFQLLKEGAVLCNAGHFDVEVDMRALKAAAVSASQARDNITAYLLGNGRTVYVLAQGRLVNLAAGDGHPVEIMDMSFALQALCAEYLAKYGRTLTPALHKVPIHIDREVAALKLECMSVHIDELTSSQAEYLYGWQV
jgi:adenosylhomocysteinase